MAAEAEANCDTREEGDLASRAVGGRYAYTGLLLQGRSFESALPLSEALTSGCALSFIN